jgi:hypothetical protein
MNKLSAGEPTWQSIEREPEGDVGGLSNALEVLLIGDPRLPRRAYFARPGSTAWWLVEMEDHRLRPIRSDEARAYLQGWRERVR